MKGNITLIVGYPGEGKTTLALQFAQEYLSSGKPCLFFCLEQTEEYLWGEIAWLNAHKGLGLENLSLLDICDTANISLEAIREILLKYLDAGFKPIVFVDDSSLVDSIGKDAIDWNEHRRNLMKSFRALADETGVDFFLTMLAKRKFTHQWSKWYTKEHIPCPELCDYADRVLFRSISIKAGPKGYVVIKDESTCDSQQYGTPEADSQTIAGIIRSFKKERFKTSDDDLKEAITKALLGVAGVGGNRRNYEVRLNPDRIFHCSTNSPMMSDAEVYLKAKSYACDLVYAAEGKEYSKLYAILEDSLEKMNDTLDWCSLKSFIDYRKAERAIAEGKYNLAKEYLLSGIQEAYASYDGVQYADIMTLISVLEKCGDCKKLHKWLLETTDVLQESYTDVREEIDQIDASLPIRERKALEKEAWKVYVEEMEDYVAETWNKKSNAALRRKYDWMPNAVLVAFGVESIRKAHNPQIGSFDWHYARAEKGNLESMAYIVHAYRFGSGVAQNQRLAEFWEDIII